jgi:hypothetical protein
MSDRHTTTVLETALAIADADLRDRHGPENSVTPWYMAPMGPIDHLYPTCPGLQRSLRPGEEPVQGSGALYPEAGDVCGWCVRVWRARRQEQR